MHQSLATTINHYQHWLTLINPNHVHIVLTGRLFTCPERGEQTMKNPAKLVEILELNTARSNQLGTCIANTPVMFPTDTNSLQHRQSSLSGVPYFWLAQVWKILQNETHGCQWKCWLMVGVGWGLVEAWLSLTQIKVRCSANRLERLVLQDRVGSADCEKSPALSPPTNTSNITLLCRPFTWMAHCWPLSFAIVDIDVNWAVPIEHPIANYSI